MSRRKSRKNKRNHTARAGGKNMSLDERCAFYSHNLTGEGCKGCTGYDMNCRTYNPMQNLINSTLDSCKKEPESQQPKKDFKKYKI